MAMHAGEPTKLNLGSVHLLCSDNWRSWRTVGRAAFSASWLCGLEEETEFWSETSGPGDLLAHTDCKNQVLRLWSAGLSGTVGSTMAVRLGHGCLNLLRLMYIGSYASSQQIWASARPAMSLLVGA